MVDSISFSADFESLNLTNYIIPLVSHSYKPSSDALLIIRMVNPPNQVTSANTNLLKIFKFHRFVQHHLLVALVFPFGVVFPVVVVVRANAGVLFAAFNFVLVTFVAFVFKLGLPFGSQFALLLVRTFR